MIPWFWLNVNAVLIDKALLDRSGLQCQAKRCSVWRTANKMCPPPVRHFIQVPVLLLASISTPHGATWSQLLHCFNPFHPYWSAWMQHDFVCIWEPFWCIWTCVGEVAGIGFPQLCKWRSQMLEWIWMSCWQVYTYLKYDKSDAVFGG